LHEHYTSGKTWYTDHYQNGKRHGELRSYYPECQLKHIERHQAGILLGGQSFKPDGTETPFTPLEKMPSFPGGEAAMLTYLSENVRYPKPARKKTSRAWFS